MKKIGKYCYLLMILVFALQIADVSAQSRRKKPRLKRAVSKKVVKEVVQEPDTPIIVNAPADNSKILMQDNYCPVENPFIFVARDAETYGRLRKMFPALSEEVDFSQYAVAAAFLGTKTTGGYSLRITKSEQGLNVAAVNPPKDAMTTQALTSPCVVQLFPAAFDEKLNLSFSDDFKKSAQMFRVESGEITVSGGFAPIERQHKLSGDVWIWQQKDLVSVAFDLKNAQIIEKTPRMGDGRIPVNTWRDVASGSAAGGKINLPFVMTGDFVPPPVPNARVEGTLTTNALSLTITPNPTNVADGYEGRGFIKAVKK